MTAWRDQVLFLSALPQVGPLLMDSRAAWIWSRDGSRLLWANPPGGRALGPGSFPDLSRRRWARDHPLGRGLDAVNRSLPDKGTMARLRIADDPLAAPVTCRAERIRAGEHRGVLLVALEQGARRTSVSELAWFFSDAQARPVILDEAGEPAAEIPPDLLERIQPGEPFLAISETGGRALRLYLVERAPDPDEAAAATPASMDAVTPDHAGLPIPETSSAVPDRRSGREPPGPERVADRDVPDAEAGPVSPGSRPEESQPRPEPRRVVAAHRAPPGPGNPAFRSGRQVAAAEKEVSRHSQFAPVSVPSPALPEPAPTQTVMAGRVARELSRTPVRFLWQTDAADRFLFVSPGLTQVVGRNAEIVGERWQEVASRLRLDPGQRIARVLAQRDTWSGQTAWWPVEGSDVRVPAELTALPIFGGDHSFQGYRGFGVLKPAEALMPGAFEARFGPADLSAAAAVEQIPPYEEAVATVPANVVPIRADLERVADAARLTPQERNAFEEIAAALRERVLDGRAEPRDSQDHSPEQSAQIEEPWPSESVVPPADHAAPESEDLIGAADDRRDAARPPEPLMREEPEPSVDAAVPAGRNYDEHPVASFAEPRPRRNPETGGERQDGAGAAEAQTPAKQDAEQRLREMIAILDTATDGVVILDAEGLIESANASAEALFGLEADAMRGMNFGLLLTPDSREAALDYLSGLNGSGVASLLNEGREVSARAGSGSIPLFMTMGRISSQGGGRFCAVVRDITHWKQTEAELVAAKRAAEAASGQKSEFLARVSHEIRTPLNAIIGFAEVMIEERFGPVENERYREYLRDIRTSGEHVVSLVNDLLDISKIEAGKLDLAFDAVPLNELVRESIALMQPQANRARVVLRSSLSRDVPAIVADQRTLRQIVLNLLSNSVKFTGPGGQVIASTSLAESGEALLRIRDTGDGMSEEELARALEPFRQITTATLADRTGTGLGLPLTKALVEANRASMAIRSAPGEGTVVTITFPPTRVLSE